MEKSDIRILKAIVHILDSTTGTPVLSDSELEFGSDFSDFLREHIWKIMSGDDVKKCRFIQEESKVFDIIKDIDDASFVPASKEVASFLYEIMNSNIDIPPADLILVVYEISQSVYLGILKMNYKTFDNKQGISCDIKLTDEPQDSMVIATPWAEDKKAFYYNQKINCMRASGTVTYKGKIYTLNPETDFAGLDWGRGVWTKDNYWYWGSGSGQINGVPFGFNLGYGFGDTTAASENVIFYDGKANKFDDVVFNISDNYTDPWTIKSSDGRFDMDFTPIIDRNALIDVKVIVTDQHQVFGKMNGTAVLDDGTKIELKDFICFAEKVHNKY